MSISQLMVVNGVNLRLGQVECLVCVGCARAGVGISRMAVQSVYIGVSGHGCRLAGDLRCDDHPSPRCREGSSVVHAVRHLRQPVVQLAGQGTGTIGVPGPSVRSLSDRHCEVRLQWWISEVVKSTTSAGSTLGEEKRGKTSVMVEQIPNTLVAACRAFQRMFGIAFSFRPASGYIFV